MINLEPHPIDQDKLVIKTQKYHIAKYTEEELQAAVLAEREACAKVCEAIYNDPNGNDGEDAYYTRPYLVCAAAIRERMK